jgi:enoyl-CoA hydratase/carnithine racemase
MITLYDRIKIEYKTKHIAVVYLSRPDKSNALDLDLMKGLVKAKKVLVKNKNIRAIILVGEGASFSSGLDFTQFKTNLGSLAFNFMKYGREENLYQRCGKVWRDIPVPVIAAINGGCFGGGLQVAMGADFRIASHDAKISMMEAKLGLIPDMSGYLSFPELTRLDQFMEALMTAKVLSAQEAKDLGLVTRVVERDALEEALEFAHELVKFSPDAHSAAKLLARKVWPSNSPRSTLFWEWWYQARIFLSRTNHQIAIRNTNKEKKSKPFKNRMF